MEYKNKVTNNTSSKIKRNGFLNEKLAFWMTRLPEALKNLPIIYLAIPGSHNTMTYGINQYNAVGPDVPGYIGDLGRYFSFISKPIIFNWSITQDDDITEQLNGGIRYLDLRVARNPTDGDIYFLHGLYGSKVYQPLQQVAEWLSSHSNEIVILDFQHFYSFSVMDHRYLVDTIFRIFKGKLCPMASSLDHITLHWLNLKKYQVIVIYRNVLAADYSNLWQGGLWRTQWPNTVYANELTNFLDFNLQMRPMNIGFVSQCVLTPDIPYVLTHPCGTLRKDLVVPCQSTIISWIDTKRPAQGLLNTVIADFVSDNNFLFCEKVIESNRKFNPPAM